MIKLKSLNSFGEELGEMDNDTEVQNPDDEAEVIQQKQEIIEENDYDDEEGSKKKEISKSKLNRGSSKNLNDSRKVSAMEKSYTSGAESMPNNYLVDSALNFKP